MTCARGRDPRPLFSSSYGGYYLPKVTFSTDGSSVVVTEPRGQRNAMTSVTHSYATADGVPRWAARVCDI